jgi:hypothetical protein
MRSHGVADGRPGYNQLILNLFRLFWVRGPCSITKKPLKRVFNMVDIFFKWLLMYDKGSRQPIFSTNIGTGIF